MTTTNYTVAGMTCGHCTAAVDKALRQLDGVTDVAVDLDTGAAEVTSSGTLDAGAVRAAVDEAGYELAAS